MIKEIYNALTAALMTVGDGAIRHIDLWNQNVEFIDEDEPWERPAVFVEFGEISWQPYKGATEGLKGTGEVLLHIVTDWKGSAAEGSGFQQETLDDYELGDLVVAAVTGLEGESFRNLHLSRTLTNHNHQEILENIEVFSVTYERVI